MEKCYEYFMCRKMGCPAFASSDDKPCWKIAGTHCNSKQIEVIVKYRKDKCRYCKYYKDMAKHGNEDQ